MSNLEVNGKPSVSEAIYPDQLSQARVASTGSSWLTHLLGVGCLLPRHRRLSKNAAFPRTFADRMSPIFYTAVVPHEVNSLGLYRPRPHG